MLLHKMVGMMAIKANLENDFVSKPDILDVYSNCPTHFKYKICAVKIKI